MPEILRRMSKLAELPIAWVADFAVLATRKINRSDRHDGDGAPTQDTKAMHFLLRYARRHEAQRTGRARKALWRIACMQAFAIALFCQIGAGVAADGLAEEDRSWGIAPPPGYRAIDYHAPTPDTLPGARVVKTAELGAMLESSVKPMLIDVLSGRAHQTLPGAIWMHNGGLGDYSAEEDKRFIDALARITGHDRQRPLVFFCSGVRCWLSYNASLRAVRAGHANVYWYRGGIDAWRAAGLPTFTADNFQW